MSKLANIVLLPHLGFYGYTAFRNGKAVGVVYDRHVAEGRPRIITFGDHRWRLARARRAYRKQARAWACLGERFGGIYKEPYR